MPSNLTILFLLVFIFAVCLSGNGVYAFGAGNIPSFAYMEGRAFRHGDIEDTLAELLKKGGGGFALASVIGKGGSKFGGLDIKRVYFGNWLRDYSQAVDIAGLKKLQLQTIINLCMALGFLAHGYATNEFEVTPERLGVYLPTEHIDNPKGYGDGEDARKYDPRLRGPVDPRELEIDPRTGMKNYIANENGSWDTSKALVRRTLEQCIHTGRMARSQGRKQDEYEAYRLLGQLLHTLEDYSAHSNFCELALINMGFHDIFPHVGDQVRIQAPNGKWVAPIVTGTFGSSDFIHSLLGEAGDHLSEASVTDLNKELTKARQKEQSTRSGPGGPGNPSTVLRDLFFKLPGGEGNEMSRDMESIERIRAGPSQGGKRPEDMSPQELHAVLWQVLSFRDSVAKKIEKTIEKIPGLGPLIEKLMDSISVFVFTTLEPFLKPILQTATTGLSTASGEVIDTHDQYEVFNDPRASDPTHSFLSKDHFNLILNEPAGQIAKVIVTNTVQSVVKAWDDPSINPRQISEDILSCLFHPDFHDPSSKVQREMLQTMRTWVDSLGNRRNEVIRRLSKQCVRNHENIRLAGEGGQVEAVGTYAHTQGLQAQAGLQNYLHQIPGVQQAQGLLGKVDQGGRRDSPGTGLGYPGAAHHSHHPSGSSGQAAAPLMGGQAADYYGGSGGNSTPPATAPSFPGGGGSGYTPSYSSPPPSFPSGPGPGHHSTPSFPGGPGSPPPSFPSPPAMPGSGPPSMPGFPSPDAYGGYGSPPPGGFAPPPGPPGSGFYPPQGPPPGFPGAHPPHGPPPGSGYAPNYGEPRW
ncbi:heterokaryon incompatibility protein het-c [Moniliophthora roreri MCA 2997]|uniref:Heterokaryon incompatibility protein het-c n=1 Tax=Moniliophthora roreri (strain MCA 2997) TaxID=1381753 RepID=V2XGN6_MONRO|nr:heterokaryon incompatibility protein het-c [Moniliophthora roreri MCA 2997]